MLWPAHHAGEGTRQRSPVGACLVNTAVASSIKENDLGTTFGGGMLAMAASRRRSKRCEGRDARKCHGNRKPSARAPVDIPQAARVRGLGLLLGIEFNERAAPFIKPC